MDYTDHDYHTIVCGHCSYSFPVPVYCGNRFCDICSARRRRSCREKLDHVIENTSFSFDVRLRFLTLTIPNVTDPAAGVRTLIESFRRLRQRKFWRSRVDAGVFVIELTGRPGGWHVHIHAIVVSRWLPVRELSRQWSQVSPGKIVDVRMIPIRQAKRYLSKYVTKSSLAPPLQQTASDALKGVRMFQFFGDWHNLANEVKKISYRCPKCDSNTWLFQIGDDWSSLDFGDAQAQLAWDLQHMSGYTFEGAKAFIQSGEKCAVASFDERERLAKEQDYLYDWKKAHGVIWSGEIK